MLVHDEDGIEKDHVTTRVSSIPSVTAPMFRFGWWWEVYATVLAVASTAAVVAVLISVQDKPLADWKLPIQPNSLVAVFSTIAKSALLVPIAECISQLKWSYFESPRMLSQMEVFENASRGPWGALIMLWKIRATSTLASVGALITVLLLAFEPFTQQVVRVETKDIRMSNETSTVSYTSAFKDYRYGSDIPEKGVDPKARLTFTLALMAAMTDRPSMYVSNNVCGESLCTYPNHVSLSTQTKCETQEIVTTPESGCAYYVWRSSAQLNTTLKTLWIDDDEHHTERYTDFQMFKNAVGQGSGWFKYGMNCTIERTDFPSLYIDYEYIPQIQQQNLSGRGEEHDLPFAESNFVAARTTAFGSTEFLQQKSNSYFGTDTLEPRNITGSPFSFCTSRRYSNVDDKFRTLDDYTLGTFSCLDTDDVIHGIAALDTFGRLNATVTHCSISLASSEFTNGPNYAGLRPGGATPAEKSQLRPLKTTKRGTSENLLEDTAASPGLLNTTFAIRPYPMIYLAGMIDSTLYSDNAQDFLLQHRALTGNWSTVIHAIASVAAEYMRSADNPDARNVTGMAWTPQPYIQVRWEWLSLPFLLVGLSVAFFTLTAVQSRTKPYLYKTSVLAATMHGLEGWSVEEMRREGERGTGKALAERAKTMEVRLVSEEDGRLRFVRQRE